MSSPPPAPWQCLPQGEESATILSCNCLMGTNPGSDLEPENAFRQRSRMTKALEKRNGHQMKMVHRSGRRTWTWAKGVWGQTPTESATTLG